MRHVSHDIRQAWSRLRRDRAFAALTVTTLALGIGANTAVFSLVRGVLLQPLPYAQPERLVAIWGPDRAEATTLSLQEVVNYGVEARSFTAVAGYQEMDANLTGGQEPERVRAASVTPNLFELLGVPPLIGRVPSPSEMGNGPEVIVLSHGLWQRRFGRTPQVVGQDILVNGRPRVVVGVMPAAFTLPADYLAQRPTEAWLPERIDSGRLGAWGNRSYLGLARLRDVASAATVPQELSAIARGWVDAGYVRVAARREPRRACEACDSRPGIRHRTGPAAAADSPGRGGLRAPDRLRQRGEPAAGARRYPPARSVAAGRPRRVARADRAATADRERGARGPGRSRRPGRGVGRARARHRARPAPPCRAWETSGSTGLC